MDAVVNLEKDGKKFSYNTKDIFHYLNADECKEGIEGYGGNSIKELNENIVNGNVRYLGQILDMDFSYTRFMVNETEDREDEEYLLFLPLEAVKTAEPEVKLEPFTSITSFCLGLNVKMGDCIYMRDKGANEEKDFPYRFALINGFRCPTSSELFIELGSGVFSAKYLFDHCEYSKDFQHWKPFGREVA